MKKDKSKTFPAISAFDFNGDGSLVAVATGDREIYIMKTNGSKDVKKWEVQHTLKEVSTTDHSMSWRPQPLSGTLSQANWSQAQSIVVCLCGTMTLVKVCSSLNS